MQRLERKTFVTPALIAAGALIGWTLTPSDAQAQERRVMVMDDGSGPMVFHMTSPDLRDLLRPDFERDDLRVFNERLGLDEIQRLVVETLLSSYLEQFDEKIRMQLPERARMLADVANEAGGHFGDDDHDQGGNLVFFGSDGEGLMISELQGILAPQGIDVDVDGGPGGMTIAVRAAIGAGGEGEGAFGGEEGDFEVFVSTPSPDGEGEAAVMISVTTPEGEALPEEVQEKLAEHAKKMAERIQERMAKAEAEGLDPMGGFNPRERMEEHMARMDELSAATETLKKVKTQLRNSFVAQVQGQLSINQLDQWPSLDRALVRKKTLPLGRLDAENLDLVKMTGNLHLDDERLAALAETLEEYELTLHGALVQRNAYIEKTKSKVDEAIREGRSDEAIDIAQRAARLRVAVREVNRQFAETLAGRMESDADLFRKKVLKASHPRIYRPTVADKAFDQATALAGLDAEALANIAELEAAFESERTMINDRLRATVLRHQPTETTRAMEHIQAMMAGEPMGMFDTSEDPIRAAFRERREFDERYMKQLYAMLSAEQVESLPKLPSARRRSMFFEH